MTGVSVFLPMSIPIIFAIDDNVVIACGVALTSLSMNALPDTHYDVFILHQKDKLSQDNQERLTRSFADTANISIRFVQTLDFSEIEITGNFISHATYCRLAIPDLFPQFDKIIYADIDMIFQQDFTAVFQDSLQQGEWIAAALDLAIDDRFIFESPMPAKVGKKESDYFNAGFLIMNLKGMRDNNVSDLFRAHFSKKYEQNDQDILNIVCDGHVEILPNTYNFQANHFLNYMWSHTDPSISFRDYFRTATLHYTWKNKPWNSLECVASDVWWYYYKQSPFYDDAFYFKRQQNLIEAIRNDYHNRSNGQLILRVLANIKHKLFK